MIRGDLTGALSAHTAFGDDDGRVTGRVFTGGTYRRNLATVRMSEDDVTPVGGPFLEGVS